MMTSFSATDAAFAGFRIIRQRPIVVVVWTLVSLGVLAVFALAALLLLGDDFMTMAQLGDTEEPSPEMVMNLLMAMIPLILVGMPVGLIYAGVLSAGVNRAILRPDEKAFFYLRLGADELRQAVVLLVQVLGWTSVYLVIALIVGLTVGFGALTSGGETPSPGGIGAMIGGILLAALVGVVLALFLMVKFSLAGAQTFQTGRINIFGSWSLTRGRFWPILGAYLLAFVFIFMISMAQSVIQVIGQVSVLSGDMVITAISVGVTVVISSLISTAIHFVAYAPAPIIYKAIAKEDTAAADVFS